MGKILLNFMVVVIHWRSHSTSISISMVDKRTLKSIVGGKQENVNLTNSDLFIWNKPYEKRTPRFLITFEQAPLLQHTCTSILQYESRPFIITRGPILDHGILLINSLSKCLHFRAKWEYKWKLALSSKFNWKYNFTEIIGKTITFFILNALMRKIKWIIFLYCLSKVFPGPSYFFFKCISKE